MVAERYEIDRELGAGGNGIVYRAHDRKLERDIALKVQHQDRLDEPARRRLLREVERTRTIPCQQLVQVFDLGESDGLTWISMELVDGEPLKDRIAKGPLEIDRAIRIAKGILEAIEQLHEHDLIHRDVKPSNILLVDGEDVKVTDFGLVRRWNQQELEATATWALIGTPAYMSPEQAKGLGANPRSDLYSLGVVLFEMLAGQLPYTAASPMELLVAQAEQPLPKLRRLRPDVPSWLVSVVNRLLDKDAEQRFKSAAEACIALDQRQRQPASRPHRRRFRMWLVSAVFGLAFFAFAIPYLSTARAPSQPVPDMEGSRFEAPTLDRGSGDSRVTATAPDGRVLWQRQLWSYMATKLQKNEPPQLVGFAPRKDNPALGDSGKLQVIDWSTGETSRIISLPTGDRVFHESDFSDHFQCILQAEDLDQDGIDEILSYCPHLSQWPSYTVLYEPLLERRRLLFKACGHHQPVGPVDLDGDGQLELIFYGISNCFGWKNGLAAVQLDPHVGKRGKAKSAFAPGDIFTGHQPNALLWYVLLPVATCEGKPDCVQIDASQKLIRIGRGEFFETVSFEGFRSTAAAQPSSPVEERLRQRTAAYEALYEAQRLMTAETLERALDYLAAASRSSSRAGDSQLSEWISRRTAHALALQGDIQAAQELFLLLATNSDSPGDVAFEAGVAFHLAGRLHLSVQWYERALETPPLLGRFEFESYFGRILALVEMGDWGAAEDAIGHFAPDIQALARDACLSYLHWRRGQLPERLYTRAPPSGGTYDLFRYWNLEFRYLHGEDPEPLLADIAQELSKAFEEYRGLLPSLQAEVLVRAGRAAEALAPARKAHRIIREELLKQPVARAHYDLVTHRRAAIERAVGDPNEATRVEEELRLWQAAQRALLE